MKLIVDSGSTKAKWATVEGSRINRYQTSGINPVHQDDDEITKVLSEFPPGIEPDQLFFFGAGCTGNEPVTRMQNALARRFPGAEIAVKSDLLGAVYALCNRKPGIACILGTGSNTCVFDGEVITDQIPPLGFILGDEGSGAHLGILLLNAYLKKGLPYELVRQFEDRYQLNQEHILDKVYRNPEPSRFLASFSPFLKEHIQSSEISGMVREAFISFFERNVLRYKEAFQLPVHFTGSIATNFRPLLTELADRYNVSIGQITDSPMEGLISFYNNPD